MAVRRGLTVSGQSPGLSGVLLNAYVAAGPEDTHVAGSVEEIVENQRLSLRTVFALRRIVSIGTRCMRLPTSFVRVGSMRDIFSSAPTTSMPTSLSTKVISTLASASPSRRASTR